MQPGINIHIYPSDFVYDTRIFKITRALSGAGYFSEIWLLGILRGDVPASQKIDENRTIYRFPRPGPFPNHAFFLKLRATFSWYAAVWKFLKGKPITCINCHSLPMLPLCVALKLRHRAWLIYDTHELETETSVGRGMRRPLMKIIERVLIRFSDRIFCVSPSISDWYRDTYRIPLPTTVRNIPDKSPELLPEIARERDLRKKIGLKDEEILFLYLGALFPDRGIERMLALFAKVPPSHHLVVLGRGSLATLVQEYADRYSHMHFLPPVPFNEVVSTSASADVGLAVSHVNCLSHYYALSNKFFEYMQAGLPILVDDLYEQGAIVRQHDAGWELPKEDSEAVAFISRITRLEIERKKAGIIAARPLYQWQHESATMLDAYHGLFAKAAA